MIKEFFVKLEGFLNSIVNAYNRIFNTQYKVKLQEWGRDTKLYSRLESKDVCENDLDINGGSIRQWYPGVDLYVDGSVFFLRLEYLYNSDSDDSKGSKIIKYSVKHKDVNWLDIFNKDQSKINLLYDHKNCKKLEDLFYIFLQDYRKVSWHSGKQQVFDNMAAKFGITSCPGGVCDYYFSLLGCFGLVNIMTSNDLQKVEKQALLVAKKMFQDALLIKWF